MGKVKQVVVTIWNTVRTWVGYLFALLGFLLVAFAVCFLFLADNIVPRPKPVVAPPPATETTVTPETPAPAPLPATVVVPAPDASKVSA